MSAIKLKEIQEVGSTASRNSESEDTDVSSDPYNRLGGRDPSYSTKINPNHWIVHGKKFDLTDFVAKHPGGAHSISFGRGRECTALVEQYHPFSDKVWNVLRKYEVKEEGDDESSDEAWPPKDPFYEDLK
jgi:cytochrome b involved in lipid metabolism